jgi:hypothetical protein
VDWLGRNKNSNSNSSRGIVSSVSASD